MAASKGLRSRKEASAEVVEPSKSEVCPPTAHLIAGARGPVSRHPEDPWEPPLPGDPRDPETHANHCQDFDSEVCVYYTGCTACHIRHLASMPKYDRLATYMEIKRTQGEEARNNLARRVKESAITRLRRAGRYEEADRLIPAPVAPSAPVIPEPPQLSKAEVADKLAAVKAILGAKK